MDVGRESIEISLTYNRAKNAKVSNVLFSYGRFYFSILIGILTK